MTTPGTARAALASSRQWRDATNALSLQALVAIGPIDLEACTPDELNHIAAWANGENDEGMPAHLVAYLGAVKDATK